MEEEKLRYEIEGVLVMNVRTSSFFQGTIFPSRFGIELVSKREEKISKEEILKMNEI